MTASATLRPHVKRRIVLHWNNWIWMRAPAVTIAFRAAASLPLHCYLNSLCLLTVYCTIIQCCFQFVHSSHPASQFSSSVAHRGLFHCSSVVFFLHFLSSSSPCSPVFSTLLSLFITPFLLTVGSTVLYSFLPLFLLIVSLTVYFTVRDCFFSLAPLFVPLFFFTGLVPPCVFPFVFAVLSSYIVPPQCYPQFVLFFLFTDFSTVNHHCFSSFLLDCLSAYATVLHNFFTVYSIVALKIKAILCTRPVHPFLFNPKQG